MIGQVIGNYLIGSLIGEGGMGAVYAAEHRLMGRLVALKVLKPQYAQDEAVVARFFNEARATTTINHPSVVEVIDVGHMPSGPPYLVMELLTGETLAARLRRENMLSLEHALHLTTQVASALGAAHAKGIVHRDLKPDNLFLVDHLDGQRVKILDFGIAKLRSDLPQALVQTQTGSLIGTPAYMSPEQCRGVSREIDHRTDIYSLGLILYQMICGRRPFECEGSGEMIVAHLQQPPPPPSYFRPDVPPAMEVALLRALAKDPAGRFADMYELVSALDEGRPSGPVSVARTSGMIRRPPGMVTGSSPAGQTTTLSGASGVREIPPVPVQPPIRSRRRWVAALAAGVTVAAALFVLNAGRRARAPGPSPSAAVVTPPPVAVDEPKESAPPAIEEVKPSPPPPVEPVEAPSPPPELAEDPPPADPEPVVGAGKSSAKPLASQKASAKKKPSARKKLTPKKRRTGLEAW